MKWMKTLLIGIALIVGTTGLAAAQDRDHDRDDRDRARSGYQDRDHDKDRDRDRDRDRRNNGYYRNGQRPVYNGQYPVYNGQYPVYGGQYPVYGGQYPVYGQNPYYATGMQQAQQNGYQWGVRDGQVDRQAGRSYRATSNETYRNANVGYVSAYGDRGQYASVFRQSYEQGYQRGYGAGGYANRGMWPWGR